MNLKFELWSVLILVGVFQTSPVFGAAFEWDPTAYYNPALFTQIDNFEIDGYANLSDTQEIFSGTLVDPWLGTLSGPGNVKSNYLVIYPSGVMEVRITPQLVMGATLNVPFGSTLLYPTESFFSPYMIENYLWIYDFSPAFGYAVTDKLSVGAGMDAYHAKAIDSAEDTFINQILKTNLNNNWNYGWHVGASYQLFKPTLLDIFYYSQANVDLSGTTSLGGTVISQDVMTNLRLPQNLRFGITQNITNKWSVYFAPDYMFWGADKKTTVVNELGPGNDADVIFGYKNAWEFLSSTAYDVTPKLNLSFGFIYSPSAVDGSYPESTLFPRDDNLAMYNASFVATYHLTKAWQVVANYSCDFYGKSPTGGVDPTTGLYSAGVTKPWTDNVTIGFIYAG